MEFQEALATENLQERFEKCARLSKVVDKCGHCRQKQPYFRRSENRLEVQMRNQLPKIGKDGKPTPPAWYNLQPQFLYEKMRKLSIEDLSRIGLQPRLAHPSFLIMSSIVIPPGRYFPPIRHSPSEILNDMIMNNFRNIVANRNRILKWQEELLRTTDAKTQRELREKLIKAHAENQNSFDEIVDHSKLKGQPIQYGQVRKGRYKKHNSNNKPNFRSIKDRLKGKTGIVRGNNMGKATECTARLVITGDPNIPVGHVGIPEAIAKQLTKLERVWPHNRARLQEMVDRGMHEWPGVKSVTTCDGQRKFIRPVAIGSTDDNVDEAASNRWNYAAEVALAGARPIRKAANSMTNHQLQIGEVVERHLMDGDIVTLGRQPSLKPQSLQGRRAIIKHDNSMTLSLNSTGASWFHFDFDGDEMVFFYLFFCPNWFFF